MKRLGITLLIVSLFLLIGISYLHAAEVKDIMAENQALAKAAKISMSDALATAMKQVSGSVIKAELENEDNKIMFSFEILPTLDSKIIKEVRIDATSGAVLGIEDENGQAEAKEQEADKKEMKKDSKNSNEADEKDEKDEKVSKESKEKDTDNVENEQEGEHGDKEGSGEKEVWKSLKIDVPTSKLPQPVLASAKKEAGEGKIVSASTMKKVYEVLVKSADGEKELIITADGKVVKVEKKDSEEKDEKASDKKQEKEEKD